MEEGKEGWITEDVVHHWKKTYSTALYRGMCVKPVYKATPSCWLFDCVHRICRGFTDADGKREFLFALPRFARDEVKTLCLW